jgi:hypothetical protein
MDTTFWLENVKGNGSIILEWILEKQGEEVYTGSIWLTTGTGGGLF